MGCNFSMINYDTIAGGFPGSMNLFWNQAAKHNEVFPSLFMTQNMGNFGFSPYMNYSNNNWLLDPGFALTKTFNQYGMTCPWTMNGGFTPGNSPSTAKTDEEIDAEEKRKELDKVISELKTAKILSDADKKKIDNAKKEAKDAGQDLVGQYEAYKAKFDEVISEKGDKIKKELLEKGKDLKLEDGTKIMDARKKLGLGRDLATAGLEVTNMAATVKSNNVLDYVEAFKDNNGDQIINEIIGYGNEGTESEAFEALQRALIGKANSLKKDLLPESKELLSDAIDTLENCSIKYDAENKRTDYKPSKEDIKAAFNELYVLTRIAAATILDSQVDSKYGKFSQVFKQNIYKEAVIADLEEDGYDTSGRTDFAVDKSASVDTDSMSEAERAEYDAEQEKRNAESNTKTIREILTLSTAYTREEMGNGMWKLKPTSEYEDYDNDACTYCYNPANGKLTKADADGNYDPNAKSVGLQALRNSVEKTLPEGEECFKNIINSFNQSGWIAKAYDDNDDNGEVTKIANEADNTSELRSWGISNINSKIDEIGNAVLNASFINEKYVNKAKQRLKEYYKNEIDTHIKWQSGKSYTQYETINLGKGKGTKEIKRYKYIFERNDTDRRSKAENTKWDYKYESGLVIGYDKDFDWDDGDDCDLFVDDNVLVKKFEMYLAEEIKKAKDELKNS